MTGRPFPPAGLSRRSITDDLSRRKFLGELGAGAAGWAGAGSILGGAAPALAAGLRRPQWDSEAARSEFGMQPGLVHMNNGTLGPVP